MKRTVVVVAVWLASGGAALAMPVSSFEAAAESSAATAFNPTTAPLPVANAPAASAASVFATTTSPVTPPVFTGHPFEAPLSTAPSALESGRSLPSSAGFSTTSPAADPAASAIPSAVLNYVPITTGERIFWIVDGTIGPQSLGVGVFTSLWQTAWNTPEEWGQGWSGIGKRYLEREADVAISNTLEAGFGAIWGEDPRYIPAPRGSIRSRIGWAAKTVMLAPRRDGHLAPAWGRYIGNTLNNVIENTYLPPSFTTPGETIWRSVSGLASRLIYNVWEEFWPDIKRHYRR